MAHDRTFIEVARSLALSVQHARLVPRFSAWLQSAWRAWQAAAAEREWQAARRSPGAYALLAGGEHPRD
jgi:hypothetical protein